MEANSGEISAEAGLEEIAQAGIERLARGLQRLFNRGGGGLACHAGSGRFGLDLFVLLLAGGAFAPHDRREAAEQGLVAGHGVAGLGNRGACGWGGGGSRSGVGYSLHPCLLRRPVIEAGFVTASSGR